MADRKSTAIGSASDVGKEFKTPNRYKGLSKYQQKKVNEFIFGGGKLSESGTAGGAAASSVGKLILKTAGARAAAKAATKPANRYAGAAKPTDLRATASKRVMAKRTAAKKDEALSARGSSARKPTAKTPTPAAASPKGRVSRADAAIQARASSIAGRASSAFKRTPGSSQAAGMAKKVGGTSAKAYNKLPGGKKTKMATAAGIGGGVTAVGAGMYADRNSGKPGGGKPKNGDTKTLGGRKATYRNGSWYSS